MNRTALNEKGTGTFCAKHPSGRAGKMSQSPFRGLFALILLCLSCATAHAQRIYLLPVGDTSEKSGLSFSTGPDLQYVFDAFYANVPGDQLVMYNNPMADFADGSSRNLRNPWEGPDVRSDLVDLKAKILRAIDVCPAGSNDTIIVFFTGHGANDDQGHFLMMPDGENRLHRKTILEHIARKRPRLAVLITDSCSLSVPSGMAPGPSARMIPPERMSPLFESLFIRSRGVVDINSSSEGEESIGAIGGGLLTLSLAYMGNQPNFKSYPGFNKPRDRDSRMPSDAKIPSVDHSMAMAEFFGGMIEHGMHGNFDPDQPPFGILFQYADQNLTWEAVGKLLTTKVDTLFKTVAPKGWDAQSGNKQMTQTPRFYSVAKTEGGRARPHTPGRTQPNTAGQTQRHTPGRTQPNTAGQPQRRWSRPIYRPEVGDKILQINGQPIRNFDDYFRAVKSSPPTMTFVLWEARTGAEFLMRTQLNPPTAKSRFGVGGENAPEGGVRVKFIMPGYPGTRCQVAQ